MRVPLIVMGKMPHMYPEPERFLPERWSRENKDTLPNVFSFLPFGFGVRMCVGEELAKTVDTQPNAFLCCLLGLKYM